MSHVVAGGLDDHTRDLLGDQMLTQCQDVRSRRTPGRHHRRRWSASLTPTRIQTFASFFEPSIPAHRGCTTSIQNHRPSTGLTSGVCSGESGVKQNSDTRARRQHSTVPVDKGLAALKLICGLTGNIVRPRSTETPSRMNPRPHRCRASAPPRKRNAPEFFDTPRWRAKQGREAKLSQVGLVFARCGWAHYYRPHRPTTDCYNFG